ncbi:MAG: MlaE family ABC transporter permease [Myxococcaceae bacterium]
MSPGKALGSGVVRFADEVACFFLFFGRTLAWAVRPPFDGRSIVQQMVRVGVDSLPVVALTAAFTGMVITLQSFIGFSRFKAESFVGALVALSMMRELGPVLSSLMVTSRVGSSMAAEIGTMRTTEQVDALIAMGTEPVQYLFVPRILAGVTMLPLLVVVADMLGILGGRAIAVLLLGANPVVFDEMTFAYLTVHDFSSGIQKAAVFGLIFSLIACQKGYRARGGAEGVGRATTSAVVTANMAIIIVDFFLTKVFF